MSNALDAILEKLSDADLENPEIIEKIDQAINENIDNDIQLRLYGQYMREKTESPMCDDYLTFEEWLNYETELDTDEGALAQDLVEKERNKEYDLDAVSDTPPVKRGRGRPRKNKENDGNTTLVKVNMGWFSDTQTDERLIDMNKENTVVTKSEVAGSDEVVKRGRGRPRTRPLPDPNAPKRPRGRPRKVVVETPPEEPAAGEGEVTKQ